VKFKNKAVSIFLFTIACLAVGLVLRLSFQKTQPDKPCRIMPDQEAWLENQEQPVLNAILQDALSMMTDEERNAFYSKWIGLEPPVFYTEKSFWLKFFIILVISAITGILIWNRSLKRLVSQKNGELHAELGSRKTAERALAESEERYRLIIEQTHHMVYDYYVLNKTITWAGAVSEITGFNQEEFRNFGIDAWRSRVHPDDCDTVINQLEQSVESGIPITMYYRFKRADGEYIHLEDKGVFLKDDTGSIYRMLGTIQDITERMRTEDEIRKFKTISDNANFGIAIIDPRNVILYSNQYFASVHGYAISELTGKHYTVCHNERQKEILLKIKDELAQHGSVSAQEIWHARKDGTEFPMMHHVISIRDSKGDPVFTAIVAFDITIRKYAEEELKKFKTISDSANYGVSIVDTSGTILYTNKYYAQVHGYTVDELTNQHFTILHNKEQMKQVEASTRVILRTDKVSGHEIWHTRKDGTVFPMLHNSVVIRDDDGEPLFTAATAIDITEQRKAEAEMEQMLFSLAQKNKELEEVNKELNNFTHVASHDLRNPISIIQSFALLIEEHHGKNLSPKVAEYVARIKRAAGRMDELVANLLTLSRISRIHNPFEEVDVNELLKTVLERLENDIVRYDVRINISSELPSIICDRIKMGEVFLNLIDNAIKYSSKNLIAGKPVEVEVGCRESEKEYEFYIKDNGVGIDKEFHKTIFESFTRLHSNDEYPGTGLGLSIVQKVIADHGGSIWIDSEEGKGSTFFFTISKHISNKVT
jgi:PAS domain S-box-containing protein